MILPDTVLHALAVVGALFLTLIVSSALAVAVAGAAEWWQRRKGGKAGG